ncbi:response regulator [Bradyrhizobium genosp. A]|uniref:response regulator n=1 Tax=Bradyrhizobium genosp. A TaxID=83626 RepID=UPI003CE78433
MTVPSNHAVGNLAQTGGREATGGNGGLDLLSRLTIRTRLVTLSGVLLCLLIATNFYLLRTLAHNSAAVTTEGELSTIIDSANGSRIAFGEMRYWMTDLAVSLLTVSERNAASARARMDDSLDQLSRLKPELVAAVRAEREKFESAANQAVDKYTSDQRIIGNSLLAEARNHSIRVDELLNSLIGELRGELSAQREQIINEVASATRGTMIADVLILAIGVLLTLLILRSIAVPLRHLIGAIDGLNAGDVSVAIPPAGPDEIGAMAKTLTLFRDSLAERKRFAAEADTQRKTMAAAIATISEGFVLYDAEDRIVLFNEQFRSIYPGLSDILAVGTSFREILDATITRSIVNLGDKSPQTWVAERMAQHRQPNGFVEYSYGKRYIRISERRIQGGGTVAVYSDITELRQRNLELEQARELSEVANQAKSQFLANMSHELRTPLNAIIGYSEILQEDAVDNDQGQLVPDLKKIEGAGRHLLGLINDILDLSKIEAGKMELFLESVDVSALIEEVRAIISPLIVKNANSFEVLIAEDVGFIRTDRTKLKQSLLNVLSNANKFTDKGKLTLTVKRLAENRSLQIAISDTGIGMAPEQLGRLFKAFSQADASTTKKFGGTGLGLAITRHFCRLLGGDVTADSEHNKGSTFTIVLPEIAEDAPPTAVQPDPELGSGVVEGDRGTFTVLVVDDDPAARDLLTNYLKRAGYRVITARNGEEALHLARKLGPDAVTLDVLMPTTDGWAVLSSFKADPDLRHIPVIMVTVAPDRGIGLSLGAADVMTKPVDRQELTARLRELVPHEGPILMIEDDEAARQTIRHTIAKLAIPLVEVTNGRLALDWLAKNPPPVLILLDLMMPEMDGFEFLDAFDERSEWRHIPVVVITAKQLSAEERNLLVRRAKTIIEKRASIDTDIATVINNAVGRRARPAAT